MPKGDGGHRSPKNARLRSFKLSDRHCAIADAVGTNRTDGIELALDLIEVAIDSAAKGDKKAIALLKKMGVEVYTQEAEPVVVKRSDGSIAAWIF